MKEKKAKRERESPPVKSMSKLTMALIILATGAVVLVLVSLLLGLLSPASSTAASPVAPYMVHVPGNDHGSVLLVGRSTCPWCMKTKELLANLSVDYYWLDLNALDEANTTQVMNALGICGQVNAVPILVINNTPPCIIGYNETKIREALG